RLYLGAVSRIVSTYGLDLAKNRSRGDVLGAASRGEALGREVDLHHGERNVGGRRACRGRQCLRRGSNNVSAQLLDSLAARDIRWGARARVLPVESDGQF